MHLSVVGTRDLVRGDVQVPNSKYHAHRALILASLAPGTSRISGLSDARHVQYTVSMLRSLGTRIEIDGGTFVVHGGPYRLRSDTITAGSSGSTLYFMAGLASLADGDVTVTGQKYFQHRPIGPLLAALRQLGVEAFSPTNCPPIAVKARRPTGGVVHIAGTLSQWVSGLLLLAPFAQDETTVVVDGPLNERTYVDLTVRMMRQFGLEVEVSEDWRRYRIPANQLPQATDLVLPPDIGSAAFGLAVGALHPADILLRGLRRTSSDGTDHPESELLDIVSAMGLPMTFDPLADGVRVRHQGMRMGPVDVDCRTVPDMLPVLATIAALADGESVFRHVEHVRLKESDRVMAMLQLNSMGADLSFDGSNLRVRGVPRLSSAHLSSFNDHRVLMSLAVAATAARGRSALTYPNAYRISYPMFLEAMQKLGLDMEVEQGPARAHPVHRHPGEVAGAAGRLTAEAAARAAGAAELVTGPEWIRRWATEKPHALALVDARWNRAPHLSWAALDLQVDQAATVFLGLGVGRGDRIAVQLPNWRQFVVIAAAAMRIGAVICPIMPIFAEREVAYALRRSGARVLLVADNFRGRQHADEIARMLDAAAAGTDERLEGIRLENVFVVHGTPGTPRLMPTVVTSGVRWAPWHHAWATAVVDRAAIDAHAPAPDDPAQLLLTSGTSGAPKGVLHTHRRLSRAAMMEVQHLGLDSSDSIFIPSPLAHQTGFLYGMWLSFTLGVPQIVQSVWDPHRALEVLGNWEGTFVQAATPFLTDLVEAVEGGASVPARLRIFVVTGAAVPRALAERATRVLGTAVCGAFGTTETGLGALSSPADPPSKAWGTDGRALPGVQLRIVDDDGLALPPDAEGNLELNSPTVFTGYLDRPDLEAETFTPDRWYRTSDLATIDDEGYLRITGRVRDIINRGGEKLPVSEIEQLMHTHPAVADVAIVAMPDPRLGERACAFVRLAAEKDLDFPALQAFLAEHGVSKHYWPERLELVDSIPRNAVGKVQKFLLRERAALLTPQTRRPGRRHQHAKD
ncbi:3-phosphoshikimate 1-carboxyvinyltransferase [Paenarthrobacter sp. Z7-10]|uniref:3-phosphoshikimate 1-carboxyvinyltransferase n=1 Tax=Paenarthrobacter sp. Z7-10 TaxID=2787635 RepID=UPI0022A9138B|nr:3-phosphoshikimate 1-carboxyvinyltransferase [Paenarthrobacter sp. Z7-10]MCZ2404745.1 3-phosphoshikimate 1-carboxyvinyltransferase [Paenarthrobacter sp. Z7-10]